MQWVLLYIHEMRKRRKCPARSQNPPTH
ncbi:unnamed protein product [Spirodela intermedia]|uniref:Uncharacterized protein n=1 Tax=Spirodela intermedia TaxID=51605 RepID=A0A7I8LC89_SPIIN|nr:unnamed protein product [Spirodela intermedia]